MFRSSVWAIDLGRSALKGVLLAPVRGGVEILDADLVPLVGPPPEGLKEPSRDMRLWEALSEFQRRHNIRKHPIAIAIPAQNALVREIKVALVGKRTLEELVQFEASNAIPFVLDEVLWDYHLFDSRGDETTKEGVIFAVKKTSIHTYLHAFSQIGAERVVEITLAPLAALSFLQFEMGQRGAALLLDLGAENTSVIVTQDARFWVRSLPWGGRRVTQWLQRKFGITHEEAEEVKCSISRSPLAGELVQSVKPALHELVAELKTSLQYCQRMGKMGDLERVYAIGGGSRLTGLKAQIRQSLGHELRDIRSVERIFVSPDADVQLVRSNLDRFAAAIGTGTKALQKVPIKASFVPESMAQLTRAASAKRFLLAAGALVWAVMLAVFLFGQQYRSHLVLAEKESRRVNLRYDQNRMRLLAARDRTSVETELAYLQSLGRGRKQALAILDEVVRAFEQSSRRGGGRFMLESFQCSPVRAAPHSGGALEFQVLIAGRIALPPEAQHRQAYDLLKNRLVGELCRSPVFARSVGTARFTGGSRTVTASNTRWKSLVQSDDQIMAQRDGVWYAVETVRSDGELLLTVPFAGGDMESEFTIARVKVEHFPMQPTLNPEFRLRAQVPALLPDVGQEVAAGGRGSGAGARPGPASRE